ncbi:MAG: hypothetical protein JSR18_11975 [Proteobacteria bacterium]|nr:hypothetical protein [Pseudomonadota bacterium]
MNQRPFAGALAATLAAGTLFGAYAGYTGLDADLGQSPALLLATVAVFLLPAVVAVGFRAALTALAQRRADDLAAAHVMTAVLPFAAEPVAVSLPLPLVASIVPAEAAVHAGVEGEAGVIADVHSLTEAKVERRQRDRRAAERRARESQFAS